jgi:hypothetical protein
LDFIQLINVVSGVGQKIDAREERERERERKTMIRPFQNLTQMVEVFFLVWLSYSSSM